MQNALTVSEKSPFHISILRTTKTKNYTLTNVELLFILEGSINITGSKLCDTLSESDIILLSPTDTYSIAPSENNSILSIKIDLKLVISAFHNRIPTILCKQDNEEQLDSMQLRKIISEIACTHFASDSPDLLLLHSLIYKALYLLQRIHQIEEARTEGTLTEKKQVDHIQALKLYILQNYNSPVTLNEIAAHLYLTPQYLSKFIKKNMGINFYDYLNSVRLENAVYEILNTENTITNIVFGNGFPNISAFNKVFKEKYHTTPQKYRLETNAKKLEPEADTAADFISLDFDSIKNHFSTYINMPETELSHDPIDSLVIEADTSKLIPFNHTWEQNINMGFAADLTKSDFRSQLSMFQSDMHFKYARFQGIFSEDANLNLNDTSSYNFYNSDKFIDYLYTVGLLPFIEIGNKPKKINKATDTHLFYEQKESAELSLSTLIPIFTSFLKQSINRYGASEVEKWKFEFWAEHLEDLTYNSSSLEEYARTFKHLYDILKAMLPNAKLGGPGFNISSNIDYLKRIITDFNRLNITPDFLSVYSFPYTIVPKSDNKVPKASNKGSIAVNNADRLPLIWSKNEFADKIKRVKKCMKDNNLRIEEIYVTEWNFDYVSRNYLNDSCFKAPFILKNILDNYDSVNLAYWLLSDISSEYKDSDGILYGGTGLISRNGIRKPAYFAYNFLSKLGGSLIEKGDGYVVTRHSDREYEVLVYNYKYISDYYRLNYDHNINMNKLNNVFENLNELKVSASLTNMREGTYRIRQYILNSEHGSVLDEWMRLNALKALRHSEISYLHNICIPKRYIYYQECDGSLSINCLLKPNEVNLFIINLEL